MTAPKKEGRTQLVGYAIQHMSANQSVARKMDLETLRRKVEAHRASLQPDPLRYRVRRRYTTCGAVYDAQLDREIAFCESFVWADSPCTIDGYDFAFIIAKALNDSEAAKEAAKEAAWAAEAAAREAARETARETAAEEAEETAARETAAEAAWAAAEAAWAEAEEAEETAAEAAWAAVALKDAYDLDNPKD